MGVTGVQNCSTHAKVSSARSRLNDECDFKREEKEPGCFLRRAGEGHGKTARGDMLIFC